MERRRFLQMMTAAAVGGAVGTAPAWAGAVGGTRRAPARSITRRPRSGDLPGIVLVQNPWTASALNAEVAKILIEENLGNSVEITAIDENTMFAGLAAGDLDACLELWPSGHHRRGTGVPRRGQRRRHRPPRRRRPDRLVRAPIRPGAVPRNDDVGRLPRSRGGQPIRQRRDRRSRSLPRHRPVLLAVRRGDHREPRPAPPGRLLRLGSCHRGGPRFGGGCRGTDPDVLVGPDSGGGQVRPRRRSSCPSTPTSATPTRPRSPVPTRRTSSSRSPRRSWPTRTRR